MYIFLICFAIVVLAGGAFKYSFFLVLLPVAIIAAVIYLIKQFFHTAKILKNLHSVSYENYDASNYESKPVGWATNKDPIYSDIPVESPQPPEFRKYNGAGYLAYQYDDVRFSLITADIPIRMINKPVEFIRESDGISVKCESAIIGKLMPHKITDMISDWLYREESCVAYLTSRNYAEMEGSFIIAFYRDELAYAQRKYDECREFKLIGNRTGEIAGMAALTNEGERCSVDYDPAHDKYAVYDDHTNIIGFLPSAGAKYYEEHDEDCVSVISRAEYDEDFSHRILYVTLFAK